MNELYHLIVCYYKASTEEHHYFHSLKNCYDWVKKDMEMSGYSPYRSYEEVEQFMSDHNVYRCGDGDYMIVKEQFDD